MALLLGFRVMSSENNPLLGICPESMRLQKPQSGRVLMSWENEEVQVGTGELIALV